MRSEMPPGWGWAKAPRRPRRPHRAARTQPGRVRVQLMRFALWAEMAQLTAPLKPRLVAETFHVPYETGRRWLAAWNQLQKETNR